jgi:hypothetical protein
MSEKKQRKRRKTVAIIADLQSTLRSMGYHYTGDNLNEMQKLVKEISVERTGKPPCWKRAFNQKSEACLRCEIIRECGEASVQPKLDLTELLPEPIECALCDGDLIIELIDESGSIVDYACSTDGCSQTMSRQGA